MLYRSPGDPMTKLIGTLVMSGAVGLAPFIALAQEDQAWSDLGIGEEQEPAPSTAPPSELPPAPQYETPPAPPVQAEAPAPPPAQAQAAPPAGQWVYTQQYGWIWMPYSDSYTYSPPNGYGEPYAYVYSPAYSCWTWLAAPWVWGFGPWPFFGVFGPAHFGWYGHGWWRYPSRWHYVPGYGAYAGFRGVAPYRGGAPYRGVAPYRGGAPYRGFTPAPGYRGPGFGAVRPAPVGPAPSRGGFVGGGHGFVRSPGFAAGRGGFSPAPAPSRGMGHGAPAFSGRGGSGGHGGGWHLGRRG
jgi:translation initiation factor IF-2